MNVVREMSKCIQVFLNYILMFWLWQMIIHRCVLYNFVSQFYMNKNMRWFQYSEFE